MQPLGDGDPSTIGPYRLLGRLGAGGMGEVYVAQNERGAPVAVKAIRGGLLADETVRARFAQEVEAAIRVPSPYIARVLDADLTADPPYLVSEYVAGESLGDLVRARGPLDGDQVGALAAGLAAALVDIHAADVVHRDLTPANVLVASDGPRVIDLGIARVTEAAGMTQTGTTVGTGGFMAPERLRGETAPASDVFSLGALLVYAATGRGPFGTGPVDALVYRTVHEDPNTAGVPDELAGLVHRMLAKSPDARPTAREIVTELTGHEGALAGADVSTAVLTAEWPTPSAETRADTVRIEAAEQPTEVVEAPRSSRRGRRAAALAVGAVLVGISAIVATAGVLQPYDPAHQEAASPAAATATPKPTDHRTATAPSPETTVEPSPTATTPAPAETTATNSPPSTTEPEVPSLTGQEITTNSQAAYDLLDLTTSHVGEIVYLDVRFPDGSDGVSIHDSDDPPIAFVPGSYPCDVEPAWCGAEYLVRDAGPSTDSGFAWDRGSTWRLFGYFAVQTIAGPHQGSLSVNLRAVPITEVP